MESEPGSGSFLVAFVDFDGLKQINDSFGHQEGNRALVDASIVLRDSFRQSDILARLGGDEFAILVADACENDIEAVRQRIDHKLCSFNSEPGRRYDLSFSMGFVPNDASQRSEVEQLLAQADARMYQQKRLKGQSRKCLTSSR